MTRRITPAQFHAAEGVEDWRVLASGPGHAAHASYRTGSFAIGLALVEAIGRVAEELDHHPDVDLRYRHVAVRLTTHVVADLSRHDVELARRISAVAGELGVPVEPLAVQVVELALDALDIPSVRPFWEAVLGYRRAEPDTLVDPRGLGPPLWFQQMDAPRAQRNRLHVDVGVPHDQVEQRLAAALTAGGRLLSAVHAPAFWVLADPEGNEACLCTWQGRD